MKDRDVTIWDSIISASMTISEQSKITMTEFKHIVNSLNLGLTLKEKLKLYRIADKEGTGKVDLQELIVLFEERLLTEKAAKVILEKFAVALYFQNMSLKSTFDYFDDDKDDYVSKAEIFSGLSEIDLGLSIFEIKQIVNLLDVQDAVTRMEFMNKCDDLYKKYDIDPSKDLSFSLYARIKNIVAYKGIDLMECFKTIDMNGSG